MYNYEAWIPDKQYGIRIPSHVIQNILNYCKKNPNQETGGILVGYYNRNHDCAIVTDCSGPPKDSKSSSSAFWRGIIGLQKWIIDLWRQKRRRYYLGEWHFHTKPITSPSTDDKEQMIKNAKNIKLQCPESVMVIIGGDPEKKWHCDTYLFTEDGRILNFNRKWEAKV